MTDPDGRLKIRIHPSGCTIDSTRPLGAAAVFVGWGIGETARRLPMLFSVCAIAQSAACAAALEQALGLEIGSNVASLRGRLVAAETLREHLWRLLLDWPCALGLAPDESAMSRVMAGFVALKSALGAQANPLGPGARDGAPDRMAAEQALDGLAGLVAERVLDLSPAQWLASVTDLGALADWASRSDSAAARLLGRLIESDRGALGLCPVPALPPLEPAELHLCLGGAAAPGFIARPDWEACPRETSPLTRNLDEPLVQDLHSRFGNGLLTRLAAQLVEVSRLASGALSALDNQTDTSSGTGLGLAQVQAARGLLIHRVRVGEGAAAADALVMDYQIVAPTEWNFHPAGAVALGLADLAGQVSGDEIEPLARLFIAAVDPCVSYSLEIGCRPED